MTTHKTCCRCELLLPVSAFGKRKYSKDGLRSECKSCRKQDRLDNLEHFTLIDKKSRDKNKEKRRVRATEYYYEHIDQKKEYDQIYYAANKQKIISQHNVRDRARRKRDPNFRIRHMVSTTIGRALKRNGGSKKSQSCLQYLPYTIQELRDHLESQFEPWMSWDNYGKYNAKTWDDNDPTTWRWQTDHIIVQHDLPYTSMEDDNFQKCWALSNLRPYSAKQNWLDGINRVRHKK